MAASLRRGSSQMIPDRQPITPPRLPAGAQLTALLVALPTCLRGQARDLAVGEDGIRILRARPADAPGRAANQAPALWGYDGLVPGPVLRVKRGEMVKLRLLNELAAETTLHWHGGRLSNVMDGVAHLTQAPIAPGASFDYRFTAPDAGTFWYHPPRQASERLRGLHGALIVDEVEQVAIDRDVLLVLASPPAADAGRTAETATVNGQASLDVTVKTNERLRLRLLNASAARPLAVRLDQHRATVMAIDGQPADPFVARDSRVVLGPGNRMD